MNDEVREERTLDGRNDLQAGLDFPWKRTQQNRDEPCGKLNGVKCT
jgi:hypothetical protein